MRLLVRLDLWMPQGIQRSRRCRDLAQWSLALAIVLASIGGVVRPLAAQGPVAHRVGIASQSNALVGQPPSAPPSLLWQSSARDHRTTGAIVGGGLFVGMTAYALVLSGHSGDGKFGEGGVGNPLPFLALGGAMVGMWALIGSLFSR